MSMAERGGEGGVVMTLSSCEDSSEIRTDKFINNSTSVEERLLFSNVAVPEAWTFLDSSDSSEERCENMEDGRKILDLDKHH